MHVITKEFVLAVTNGARALYESAYELERTNESKGDDAVGRTLRYQIEAKCQQADMLIGWARRSASQAGINPEEIQAD